jgi:hypothetical protein
MQTGKIYLMGSTRAAQPGHLLIASLLSNPLLTQAKVAELAGVSTKTVGSVASMLREASSDKGIEIEAYRMLLREHVPVKDRVSALQNIVSKSDSNPFAALKGIEYVDNALGIAPKQQIDQQVSDNTRPMFVLPPGTTISVTTPQQAIDITPEYPEDFKHDL